VEGYVDPEICNAVCEAKYLTSAILKESSNDLQPGTSTSSASGSNDLHSNNDAILNLLQQNQQLFERLAAAVESSGCSSTEHTLYGCQQFLDMSGLQRRSFVKEKSLYYNCLRPGHGVNRCKSTYKCRQCKGNHHSLLHVQQNPQAGGNLA